MVNGAAILEIDEGVGSVGSNRFVGQNSDETMVNMNVVTAMAETDDDRTLCLDQRQSERLTEDIGDLDCLLVEAAGWAARSGAAAARTVTHGMGYFYFLCF